MNAGSQRLGPAFTRQLSKSNFRLESLPPEYEPLNRTIVKDSSSTQIRPMKRPLPAFFEGVTSKTKVRTSPRNSRRTYANVYLTHWYLGRSSGENPWADTRCQNRKIDSDRRTPDAAGCRCAPRWVRG